MVKKIRIGLFDQDWSDYSPDPKPVPEDLKKSDGLINRTNAIRQLVKTSRWKKAQLLRGKRMKESGAYKKISEKRSKTLKSRFQNEPDFLEKRKEIGRKITASKSFIEAREKDRQSKIKPVITPFGKFPSINDAFRGTSVDIFKKLKSLPHLYYEEHKGPGPIVHEVVFITPHGRSNKKKDVWNFCNDASDETCSKNTRPGSWWHRVSSKWPKKYFEKKMPAIEWTLVGLSRNKIKVDYKNSRVKVKNKIYKDIDTVANRFSIHRDTVKYRINSEKYQDWKLV